MTNLPGVFAGGDFTTGPRNVIEVISDEHKAAASIDRFLTQKEPSKKEAKMTTRWIPRKPESTYKPTGEFGKIFDKYRCFSCHKAAEEVSENLY